MGRNSSIFFQALFILYIDQSLKSSTSKRAQRQKELKFENEPTCF